MNKPIKVWHFLIIAILLIALGINAQNIAQTPPAPPVTFFGTTAGTTVSNCGTPATPSLCGVATGWYVWTDATNGWVQIGTAAASAGVASVTVCNATGASCGTPATGAVTLNIPKTAATTLQ